MCRAGGGAVASGSLTRTNHIFETEVTDQNGIRSRVISSQPLGDSSIRVNRTWYGERWEGKKYVKTTCTNAGALYLLLLQCVHDGIRCRGKEGGLQFNEWHRILHFLFGFDRDFFQVVQYTMAVCAPSFFSRNGEKWYQDILRDSSLVIGAAMRGQEDVVLNILRAAPSYLLQKATVENSVGVEYEVTALQAAIMANDAQMVERMREHFARLTTNSFDGIAEMHRQIKEIYTLSLKRYFELEKNNRAAHKLPIQIRGQIIEALQRDYINSIFEAHCLAQENNAFDFSPYVDAILRASQAELDDAMALINARTEAETDAVIARTGVASRQTDVCRRLPFYRLTLVQKLNYFREKFVEHMQQEIIFNPHHISGGLKFNETVCSDRSVHFQDQNYHKRSMIFSQLCGWAQRNASESTRQDFRQGLWSLANENEPRSRQSRFNKVGRSCDVVIRNSCDDVSLIRGADIDGVGYKFALLQWPQIIDRGLDFCAWIKFSDLMSSNNSKLSELVMQPTLLRNICVMQ